jgi:hypothetical protein
MIEPVVNEQLKDCTGTRRGMGVDVDRMQVDAVH